MNTAVKIAKERREGSKHTGFPLLLPLCLLTMSSNLSQRPVIQVYSYMPAGGKSRTGKEGHWDPQGANRKQALQETNFCFQFSSVKMILQLNKCDKKEGQLRIFWDDNKYREKSRRLRLENIGCDLCLKSASYRCGWLCSLHRERGK